MADKNRENVLSDPAATFRGISFPFRKGSGEIPKTAIDEELIADTLAQLILTSPGERVMRPTLGSGAPNFLFETNDRSRESLVKTSVANTIGRFERRVLVTSVDVKKETVNRNTAHSSDSLVLKIAYVVPATQEENDVSIKIGLNQGLAT